MLGIAHEPLSPGKFTSLTTLPSSLFPLAATDRLAYGKVLTTSASSAYHRSSSLIGAGMGHWLMYLFHLLWGGTTGQVGSYIWVCWAADAERLMQR